MDSTGFFHLDESRWPLAVFEMYGEPSDAQHAAYLDVMEGYALNAQAHLIITDLSRAGVLTTRQRRYHAEWALKNEPLLRETLLGSVYVMNSPFQRLCLNVIFSLKPPQYPHLVVSHLESALLWAAERFEAANLRETAACVREHPALRRAASAG